jgi:nucleotide-binding universal stress UspA family protein
LYRKILVPIDDSRTSARGLLEAIRLARSLHSKLRLVHIVEEFSVYRGMGGAVFDLDGMLDFLRTEGEKIIGKAMAVVRKHGATADSVMCENAAYRTSDLIVEEARKWRADLIVMGTHGRRGVSRLVMGSDAEIVLSTSPVPVLLVQFPEPGVRQKKSS